MPSRTNEIRWDIICSRIEEGRCTPFLGAGVNFGILDLGEAIARTFAEKFKYPFEKDAGDLVKVSQYVSVIEPDPMVIKDQVLKLLHAQVQAWREKIKPLETRDLFRTCTEPLGILASLPFPIYMTTNYDDLLLKALVAHNKNPKRELSRWNSETEKRKSVFSGDFKPSTATPVVFHLHGHDEMKDSIVLTEDDYVSFLVKVKLSGEDALLPDDVRNALVGSSLLFIGYALEDWSFRVLFKGLVGSLEKGLHRVNIAVQLPKEKAEQEKYLVEYFRGMNVQVYWGNAQEFALELKEQWERYDRKQ